jgi:hypothetical protein
MADQNLTLTSEERDCLIGLLQAILKETLVEEHRTKTLTYRQYIVQKEHLVESVLSKLKKLS